jgi:glycosyltransferase involved in cell wall biosynthesis
MDLIILLMFETNYTHRIHLAVITETGPPEINGVAYTINHLVQGLRKLDQYHIELVRPRQSESDTALTQSDLTEHLVGSIRLPFYKEVRLGMPHFFALRKRWKQRRPDIVQIVTEGPLGYTAMLAGKSLGIPVFSDFHTNFDQYSRHYHMKFGFCLAKHYLRHLHNQTLRTLVPTKTLMKQLEEIGYQNLAILDRGIDADLFHPSKRSDALRESLGIHQDQLLVVLVTRMAPEKNLDLAFAAFREIQQKVSNARFLLVGDGPDRQALEAKHPDCIFAGMQTGEALAAHYASGDLFLYPSTSETFGNVIIEAMASGLPVLTYDYAAAHKYIQSGHNGVTVPFDDEAAFLDAAATMVKQAKYCRSLGIEARVTAQHLGWDGVVKHLDAMIKDLLTEVYHETTAPA